MTPSNEVDRLLAEGSVRGLCRALRHRNALVRRSAARALGDLGDPQGVACLARALSDADEVVRRRAVESLQRIGDPAAIGALIAAAFGAHPLLARLADAQRLGGVE